MRKRKKAEAVVVLFVDDWIKYLFVDIIPPYLLFERLNDCKRSLVCLRLFFIFWHVTEPAENWTIEQVMHWWLLRAHGESDAAYEEMVKVLSKQLEDGKSSLWDEHKRVSAELRGEEPSNENADPQQQQQQQSKHVQPQKQQQYQLQKLQPVQQKQNKREQSVEETSLNSDTIHIDITAGEYEGCSYELQIKPRACAWVGRSQGKKFREKGISLPKDVEVSTTHGKFEFQRSKFFYVDTGSTNGSRVDDEDVEPNVAIELQTGMEICIGQTIMLVTVPY